MKASEVRHWFDVIKDSPEGMIVRIPCGTVKEVDSARSQFYRERTMYVKKFGAQSKDIGVQRLTVSENMVEELGGKHFVVLTMGMKRKQAVMTDASGVETTLPPFIEEDATPKEFDILSDTSLSPAQKRMYKLMVEDGHSEVDAMVAALASDKGE